MSSATTAAWLDYWDHLPADRLLLAPESEEYVRNLTAVFPMTDQTRVLDFGCGYGTVAERLAQMGAKVDLWDAAPMMLRMAVGRLSEWANVNSVDLTNAATQHGPYDFVLVNSVVQYMTASELQDWLRRWRSMLAHQGRVVLSDLIPARHSTLRDILSLVRFGVRHGYLFQAMRGIWKEWPRYHAAASQRPLLHINREELTSDATRIGYTVRFLPRNFTHFAGRTTAVLEASPA